MPNKPNIEAVFDFYGLKILNHGHGSWRKCECPMPDHPDNNPSASVNTDEGIFKCHACGARGDAYDIVESRESVDTGFADVKRRTEEIAGRGDGAVSPGPAVGSSLLGRPRSKRTGGGFVPPWRL